MALWRLGYDSAAARLAARLRACVLLRGSASAARRRGFKLRLSIATPHEELGDGGDGSDDSGRSDGGDQHEDEPECAASPAMRGVRSLESM